ncbi:murein L,D-transpeptidase [Psychromonas sp.]|uniref:L,D-transpeptidase family protein n=1 Tax=Psychromonas sp. TaxID=1884585 RepID=UPI0035645118
MIAMRLLKNILSLFLLCQIAFFPLNTALANAKKVNISDLNYSDLIISIYRHYPDKSFWSKAPLRDEFEKQISILFFADISDDLNDRYQALTKASERKDWKNYELLASDLLLFYLSYNEQLIDKGKSWLLGDNIANKLRPPSDKSVGAFFNAYSDHARLLYLQRLSPISDQKMPLYSNLLVLNEAADKNIERQRVTESVKIGDTLQEKGILLSRLQVAGELSTKLKELIESENHQEYSAQLGKIVKSFQMRHGLKPDGIIGNKTRYWLNISRQERIRLMALNILREALWSADQDNKIVVNIPGYQMSYWETEKMVFESNIIVGQVKRKTPIFTAKLDSIVFNPTWNVPTSIMREDILPKALVNSDYLKRHRYEILQGWHSNKVIEVNAIDWSSVTVNNFPYRLRQKSGRDNALGFYKFNTPNKNAIYLHDTPAKYLFERENRAFSSGCIRVQKAKQFTLLLMDRSGYTFQDYKNYRNSDTNSVLPLKKNIRVYTVYQTVWVDQSGLTQFRNDIYDYDKPRKRKIS